MSGGIEFYQIIYNILYPGFGSGFEIIPRLGAEFVNLWRFSISRFVFGNAVDTVNRDKNDIVVFVNQFYSLLYLTIYICLYKTSKLTYSIIYMHHIIPDPECHYFIDGKTFGSLNLPFDLYLVITFEYLVVGIVAVFRNLIHIAFMK